LAKASHERDEFSTVLSTTVSDRIPILYSALAANPTPGNFIKYKKLVIVSSAADVISVLE
jgi:hypothetical protein